MRKCHMSTTAASMAQSSARPLCRGLPLPFLLPQVLLLLLLLLLPCSYHRMGGHPKAILIRNIIIRTRLIKNKIITIPAKNPNREFWFSLSG